MSSETKRAYLDRWTGAPLEPPQLHFAEDGVHALWNGATGVAQWRLLHGELSTDMTAVSTVAWDGADTTVPLDTISDGYYQLEALDAAGHVLSQTPPIPYH